MKNSLLYCYIAILLKKTFRSRANNTTIKQYNNGKSRGFTLIELLIVIAIIAVMATGTIMIFNPLEQIQKTSDAKRKSDLAQLQRALELYYQDYNAYPLAGTGDNVNKIMVGTNPVNWGTAFGAGGIYMQTLPKDPKDPDWTYMYVADSLPGSKPQSYKVYASLERGIKDPQICFPATGAVCSGAPASCGVGHVCNYGVSSQNTSP